MSTAARTREQKPLFFAWYNDIGKAYPDGIFCPPGWYIGCSDSPGWRWSDFDGAALCFANQRDCQCAIDGLAAAGIYCDADIESRPEREVRRIACESLAW